MHNPCGTILMAKDSCQASPIQHCFWPVSCFRLVVVENPIAYTTRTTSRSSLSQLNSLDGIIVYHLTMSFSSGLPQDTFPGKPARRSQLCR